MRMAEGGGRRRSGEAPKDPRAREVPGRRPGPKHAADDEPAPRRAPRARKAAPVSAAPASPAPRPGGLPSVRGPNRSGRVAYAAGRVAADRRASEAARAHAGAKPSTVGRAGTGAAAGAATGAALGSIIPGVGTAAGAGTGAVVGGAGGAVSGHRAKAAWKAARRPYGNYRRALVAEFTVCAVVVALSPMTDAKRDEPPGAFMKRMSALMGVFFVLGLVSALGGGAAKLAAGFGGLVTVALVISERDLFTKLAQVFNSTDDRPQSGPGPGGGFLRTGGIGDIVPAGG